MSWQLFSKIRFYTSVGIALVGLSAASTLIMTPASLAQQPAASTASADDNGAKETVKDKLYRFGLASTVSDDDAASVLRATLAKKLAEELAKEAELKTRMGEVHPEVQAVRAKVAALKAVIEDERLKAVELSKSQQELSRAAAGAARSASAARGRAFQTSLDLAKLEGDVLTENIIGTEERVIVQRTEGGDLVRTVEAFPTRAGHSIFVAGGAGSKQNKELQKAVEQLKAQDAKDEDKQAARQTIEKILSEQFDDDLKQREEQVAQLEKKLATLKEQLGKRRDAKQRLMELRIELLINESEGLGFPNAWQGAWQGGVSTSLISPLSPAVSRFGLPAIAPVAESPALPVIPAPATPPASPAPPALPSAPGR